MKPEFDELLSAFLDGEDVPIAELAAALEHPQARERLREFVLVRGAVREDESRPRPDFYSRVKVAGDPKPALAWGWNFQLRGRAAALVTATAVVLVASVWFGARKFRNPSDPPAPTRVIRFEPGVDWDGSK